MKSLSVKELRNKMPFVRSQLKKGEEFLVIFQSKPIAKLSPLSDLPEYEEASDLDIEAISIQQPNDEFLTKEELAYYLDLIKKQ